MSMLLYGVLNVVVSDVKLLRDLNSETRIRSGIESRLLTHGPKFDRESLYEPIKFETLHPHLVNKY